MLTMQSEDSANILLPKTLRYSVVTVFVKSRHFHPVIRHLEGWGFSQFEPGPLFSGTLRVYFTWSTLLILLKAFHH